MLAGPINYYQHLVKFINTFVSEESQAMKSVVHRVPITIARVNLGQVVRRAHLRREYFILRRTGFLSLRS